LGDWVILFGTFGTDELGEYASQVDIVARLQRLVNSGEHPAHEVRQLAG
jgi:hypothetical protein